MRTARHIANLAKLYDDQGRYADAEPLFRRALAIHEKARGPDHPRFANSLNNLALLYFHSLRALPCSTRITMRLLSMSLILIEITSAARRPAP
jgi:tetratricopeptide (TPR) repeat protein